MAGCACGEGCLEINWLILHLINFFARMTSSNYLTPLSLRPKCDTRLVEHGGARQKTNFPHSKCVTINPTRLVPTISTSYISSWPFDSLVASLISSQGHFTCFTNVHWLIGLVDRVFTNGPRDWGSIPGWVTPKTLKMVLDKSLLNTQQYKVHIKGKVEQSKGRSSTLLYTSVS